MVVENTGTHVEDYPMGTFVEDYVYDPLISIQQIEETLRSWFLQAYRKALGRTKRGLKQRDGEPEDSYDFARRAILNENTIKMNTPEFPKELYPDGVWCHTQLKIYTNEPQFPYLIG